MTRKAEPMHPYEVTQVDIALADEMVGLLKERGRFNEPEFNDFIAESGTLVDLPDTITPEWMHATAERLADRFELYTAGVRLP